MRVQDKTTEQLLQEVTALRQRLAAMEGIDLQRRRAEEALREREARLLEAQEVASLGFYVLDIPQGRWTSSRILDQIFDIPADYEKTIEGWGDLIHPNDRQPTLDHFAHEIVAGGKPCDREYRIVRWGDKQVRWVHGLGRLQFDDRGRPAFMLGTVQDITERRQAEEALQQAHDELERRVDGRTAELRAIYDGMRDGLLIADVETKRFLRANPAICRMLGYSEIELLSMTVPDIHPAEAAQATLATFQAESEGRIHVNENSPVLRQDGSVVYADIACNTLTYAGRPCVVGIFRDVTERRMAHEALLRERRTLKHMLEASDHERRLISYDIHDGLAQDLAGAIMQFQIYAHARQENPKDAAKTFDAGMTMLRQSHIEARRLISGVRPLILDESGVVAAIVHLVYDPVFEPGPKIDFRNRVKFKRLAPTLENAIYRIVQEGLTNARKHSKSENILVSLTQRGERLRIKIRDWGVGFDPPTVQENRFGLEGIRERARLLGGKCRIRSILGGGTTVTVELPVVERRPEE